MSSIPRQLDSNLKLPGYECQLNQSGLVHSRCKLQNAANNLKEIEARLPIHMIPCDIEEVTHSYRVSCSFQIVSMNGNSEYAMRQGGQVVLLQSDYFPIAVPVIQKAMVQFLKSLRESPSISKHLTSVTFKSTWDQTQLVITLHYKPPGLPIDSEEWIRQASTVQQQTRATFIIGQSKGRRICVPADEDPMLRDEMQISLMIQKQFQSIKIHYIKPCDAFQHPNPNVMCQALDWLLSTTFRIKQKLSSSLQLLELYNGYGAHTVPLALSGLYSQIVCLELDDRLVRACRVNIQLNNIENIVQIMQGDAGEFSRTWKRKKSNAWSQQDTTVLLVDPPRQGLDMQVCEMANQVLDISHILYVSCGREALLRDVKQLQPSFSPVSSLILYLFTDSVETLVHFERRVSPDLDPSKSP